MGVGVLGAGMIAQALVPHFGEWGLPVDAVCGTRRSEEKVRDLAARVGAAPFTDYAAMLAMDEVDAVYIAVPNHLHYRFALEALEVGKHVIVEKPITSTYAEALELSGLARGRGLLLYEAISTVYQPNFARIRALLPRIGSIRIASVNYSQYSSRFDAFQAGTVLPAFDPAKAGGALMDLGLYNLQFLIGLFGEPQGVTYHANVERGIDTSGVCELDYGGFQAVSVAAKDCAAPALNTIQGTKGYLLQTTPAGTCGAVTLHLNDGTEEVFDENPENRWESEFRAFAWGIASCGCDGDGHARGYGRDHGGFGGLANDEYARERDACYRALDHSLLVSRVMTEARRQAGIRFPADEAEAAKEGR